MRNIKFKENKIPVTLEERPYIDEETGALVRKVSGYDLGFFGDEGRVLGQYNKLDHTIKVSNDLIGESGRAVFYHEQQHARGDDSEQSAEEAVWSRLGYNPWNIEKGRYRAEYN